VAAARRGGSSPTAIRKADDDIHRIPCLIPAMIEGGLKMIRAEVAAATKLADKAARGGRVLHHLGRPAEADHGPWVEPVIPRVARDLVAATGSRATLKMTEGQVREPFPCGKLTRFQT
jgi:hypothetical protein